jgi:hypothetical protein
MNSTPRRRLWLRKRVLLPALFLVGMAFALPIAVLKSDTSRIIIYNETGRTISGIRVLACGQETSRGKFDDEESFRWKLGQTGAPGEITIETATSPPWHWNGGYIKPRGGYRIIITLLPDGETAVQTQISIWQRWSHGWLD